MQPEPAEAARAAAMADLNAARARLAHLAEEERILRAQLEELLDEKARALQRIRLAEAELRA